MKNQLIIFLTILILLTQAFSQDCKAQWAKQILNQLTVEQKIGQLFIVGVYNNKFCKNEFIDINTLPDLIQKRIVNTTKKDKFNKKIAQKLIQKYNIGGIHLLDFGSIKSCFDSIEYFQSISKIPLLISQDFEWGLTMRLHDAIRFPRNMTLGAIQDNNLIYQLGKEIGRQCKLLGLHINFAPVIDINSNPNNPVIGDRSFGSNKENVAQKGIQVMLGLQDAGIISCAKHFCGHGDTITDSHLDLPIINHTIERINDFELYPFKGLINNGVKAIMSAHIHVPSIDSRLNRSLTLSQNAMTELLQNKLKFSGLIITDALDMQGITKHFNNGEAALEAFLAGNDILLMCEDVPKAINTIKKVVQENELLQKELDRRVLKILTTKEKLNLHITKNNAPFIYENFHTNYAKELKSKLYESAITIIDNQELIIDNNSYSNNCSNNSKKIALIQISNNKLNNQNVFYTELKKHYKDLYSFNISLNNSPENYNNLLNQIEKYETIIIGLFDINKFAHLNYGINQNCLNFLNDLKQKTILTIFGSPYSLKLFNNFKNIIIAYENDVDAQIASAKVISGKLKAIGKLPI